MSFAAIWMQLEIIIVSEISQKVKDKYCMIFYMWNITQMKQNRQHRKQTSGFQELGVLRRKEVEGWVSRCKFYIQNVKTTRSYSAAKRTIFNILW